MDSLPGMCRVQQNDPLISRFYLFSPQPETLQKMYLYQTKGN